MIFSRETFRSALSQAGLVPPENILKDGTLQKCSCSCDPRPQKTPAWFIYHGDEPANGIYGCFKCGISGKWASKGYDNLTQEEKTRYAAKMEAAKKARDAEQARIQADCRAWCTEAWEKAKDATNENPYLQRKGVHSYGLKAFKDSLLVPVRDLAGTIHGMQFISPDGSKRFKTGTNKAGHFYKIGKSKDNTVIGCEGYATGASIHMATGHSVVIAFDAGNLKAVAETIRSKYPDMKIILAADDDHATEGNPGLAKATEAAKAVNGLLAVPAFQNAATRGTDFNDLHQAEGLEAVRHCIEAAEVIPSPEEEKPSQGESENLQDTIKRLSALHPLEYEQLRKEEASRLRVRAAELDKVVRAARKAESEQEEGIFPSDNPWDEQVNGNQLVQDLAHTFERFSVLPRGSAITAALWAVLTYCFNYWNTLPILSVVSPEKRCGKTTFLTTLTNVCYRALPASNITPAVLYRAIEAFKPTLLIDEGDTFLRDNEELRGVINSGHTKATAFVLRCEGDDNQPARFSTWCPKAIAMIGVPPDTIQDRSIIVNLRRKLPNEQTERQGDEHNEDFQLLRSMILRWIDDNESALRLARPDRLNTQNDRQADNWLPLLAIAQVAGCEAEARDAAILTMESQQNELPAKIQLLHDIRSIFEDSGMDRISSAALVKALVEMEDRPWCEWKHGKPLTQPTLSRLLKPFNIHSKTLRLPNELAKGYELESFKDTFTRYTPDQSVTTLQSSDISKISHSQSVTRSVTSRNRNTMLRFQNVTVTEGVTDNHLISQGIIENVTCYASKAGALIEDKSLNSDIPLFDLDEDAVVAGGAE